MDFLRQITYVWYYFKIQFDQIFYYYILGILLGSFISVFLKKKINSFILHFRNARIDLLSLVIASILGIISPLCLFGTIPLAASLSESGLEDDFIASFMMSSILLNPQLIIYSSALGETVLIIRILTAFLCGWFAGILVKCLFKKDEFFNFKGFKEPRNKDINPNLLIRYLENVYRNLKATLGYFLLGILLSALFQLYIPSEWIENLFGDNGFGVLMAATIGVPLYACGGGTIPLLRVWLFSGMGLGSAAAFMITGPATKITNLGALKIVLGRRNFLYYILYIIMFALVSGMIINQLESFGILSFT